MGRGIRGNSFSVDRFEEFLIEAKQNTYAGSKEPVSFYMGGKGFTFDKDGFFYVDTYWMGNNNLRFAGLEKVYFKSNSNLPILLDADAVPVWSLVYHGGIIVPVDKEREEKINSFLRECLLKVPRGFPVRGPIGKSVIKGNLRYDNFSDESNLFRFTGVEMISFVQNDESKEVVHEVNYCGGFL